MNDAKPRGCIAKHSAFARDRVASEGVRDSAPYGTLSTASVPGSTVAFSGADRP